MSSCRPTARLARLVILRRGWARPRRARIFEVFFVSVLHPRGTCVAMSLQVRSARARRQRFCLARDARRTLMAGLAASMRVFLEKAAGQGRHEPAWFDAIVAALAAESASRPSALAGAHFKDFQFRGADFDGGQKRCIREAIALATRDEAHALRITSRPHRACACAQAAAEVQRPVPARVPAARGAAVDTLLDLRVAEAQGARPPQCGGGPRAELRNLRRRLDSQEGPVSVAEWLSSARAAALLGHVRAPSPLSKAAWQHGSPLHARL